MPFLQVDGDVTVVYRRNLRLKAQLESGLLYYSFKRLVPGAFNTGFMG
jgi:hypothetical protein